MFNFLCNSLSWPFILTFSPHILISACTEYFSIIITYIQIFHHIFLWTLLEDAVYQITANFTLISWPFRRTGSQQPEMITPRVPVPPSTGQRGLLPWEGNTGHPKERNLPSQTSHGASGCVLSLALIQLWGSYKLSRTPSTLPAQPMSPTTPTSLQTGLRVTFLILLSALMEITGNLNHIFQWVYYPYQEKPRINHAGFIAHFYLWHIHTKSITNG